MSVPRFINVSILMLPVLLFEARASATDIPRPDREFTGRIETHATDSVSDPSLFKFQEAPDGSPNILLILLDDAGYASNSVFGGPAETPTLDRLAQNGLRYTGFHTTALCSPTRAALLTGHNHHSAATGVIMELGTGYPGYTGILPRSTATIGRILQNNGFSTAFIGKQHNVPDNTTSMVGPYARWTNQMGFDYFYGFVGGEADQWYPSLYENMNEVSAPATPAEGYNLNADITDRAITWMQSQNSIAPDRPFFMYFAPGAVHAPHHAPKEWIEKYKGKFSHGYDRQREIAHAKQIELGVIPKGTKLTPRPESIPSWDSLDKDSKRLLERQMETYAGYLSYIDHEIGRLVDAIKATGELDNTLIIYITGDNGSSAEGGFGGTANEVMNLNGIIPTVEQNLRFYDDWGGPETSPHFAVGWAWATNAPFQWAKQVASHFGGTRNGMVLSWPKQIKARGEIRGQFHHVNDIAPTILDVLGLEQPDRVDGIEQKPMEGISLAYTFNSAGTLTDSRKKTQYFEMFGNRAIYHDGWIASVIHRAPWDIAGTIPWANDVWELYDLNSDFSQANDLASQQADRLKNLQQLFDTEAKTYNVYPLDDRMAERFDVSLRPSFTSGRNQFVFYDGMPGIPEGVAPDLKNKSHRITIDVDIPNSQTQGSLLAMGGGTGGFGVYLNGGKLKYRYDWFGYEKTTLETSVPVGSRRIEVVYEALSIQVGGPAKVSLLVDGAEVDSARIPKTVPQRFGVDKLDVGKDSGAAVSSEYAPPFEFKGKIKKVEIAVAPAR